MSLQTHAGSFRPFHRIALAAIAPAAFALLFPIQAARVAGQAQRTLDQRSSSKLIVTPDPNVKWRITAGDFVERSVDGGATWHGQEVAAQGSLLAGSAPNAKVCWVVGRDGVVYATKDGKKWKKLSGPSASANLVAVSVRNASSATVTTADGRQFATRDSGRKWTQLRPKG